MVAIEAGSARPGHLAEVKVVEFLRDLPGVESAELSNELEDIDKVDVLLRLRGDYEPLKIQLTGNPSKSPKGLPKDICFIRFNLWVVVRQGISQDLGRQILARVISWTKKNSPETFEGLLAYWGI